MVLGSGTEPATCFVAPLDLFGPWNVQGALEHLLWELDVKQGNLPEQGTHRLGRTQSDHIGSTA